VKALSALLCLLTAACAAPVPHFGEAQAINDRLQIADPAAGLAEGRPLAFDGTRAAAALQRYRDGKVIKPSAYSTSSIPGSSQP
jgi:hypothetical protein